MRRIHQAVSSVPILWCIAGLPFLFAIANCAKKLVQASDQRLNLGNLATFRDAGMALGRGEDIYRSGIGQYVYPPLIAFLYQPLGWISLRAGGILMLIIGAVAGGSALWVLSDELVRRLMPKHSRLSVATVAAIAAWLSIDHIRTEFNQWETNVFVLLMLTLGLRWSHRYPVLAGAALGLAFNIKYVPLALVPLLLLRRRWLLLLSFGAFAAIFAILPAASMGWGENVAATAQAYGGLGRLLGLAGRTRTAAPLQPFTSLRSVSIPSALGRMTGWPELRCMIAAAILAGAVVAAWAWVARRRVSPHQIIDAGCIGEGRFGLEWVGTILLVLIFSPYTNSGHLYLLLPVNVVAAIFLIRAKAPTLRWMLPAGVAVMLLGGWLPPGFAAFRRVDLEWRRIGGVGWCMLCFLCTLIQSFAVMSRNTVASASGLSQENHGGRLQ